MHTEMHRPGDAAAAADTAAKPVLGDIIEHVYEDDTHNNKSNNNNSNDEAATTTTSIGNSTSAQGLAAADAAATTTLAEPHVVHVTERLAARLRPIQAVVGQAFPPVRPHTSYRIPPPPSASSTSNAQTAGRPHAAMQRTERTLPAGDATRATTAMSAAVPSQHRHHHQQYTDAAAVHDSHTPPAAAALATSSSSRRVQGGMQYSAHVQPDMPSLEESTDRATTLRFSRPSFAAALPTSHTTTTTATRTTTTATTKSDDVVQPSAVHNASGSNNSNSSTTATTYEMPELLGRLPVGGISMRNTATSSSSAAGDASAAAAESVAVPHQWSPTDFVHMYRGYYAVPMTEGGEKDVLAAAQQEKEEEEMYGYGLPHALQDWSHNNNNSTTTTTSEPTTTTSAHDANSVPTGEAYLRLLRCGLCSTVPRHQVIAMHALLLHLRYEGAVLRARCLQGGGAGGGDRHEGVDWLQGLLTRMTQATQVLPCKLAARCLLALLSPTTNNNNNNNKKSSTSMSAAAAAAANAMQPSEVLVQALREVAFPLTDATTAHKARRGEHSEEQGEDDEGDETRAGPQLPRTMDEVERLLGSGDEADIALAAEALGLTEKLLLAMPLLLHTISPPQQQQQHEEEESEEEGNDEMRAVDAGRHTAAAASTTNTTQGDDGHNNRASGISKRPAHNTSSSSISRRAHAAETLFLRLLRCGGVGLSEQTSCMRVARDVPFALRAEQQLSDVVLGERGLASVLPLLGVLHDLAHCPAALTVLLTTMSSSSSISSSSSAYTSKLLTNNNNNNNNNTRVAVAGRGSNSNSNNDASARAHAAAHETWLLFALYVCSMDVTRKAHTRRTHTGHGGDAVHTCNTNNNTNKDEDEEENDEEEEEMAAAMTMSLLLLRELIRHGVGLTLFLRDACGTILETGMTMGAAMLLEMWLVLLDQQQEEQQEQKKDEEGNDPHNKDSSTCTAHVHERPEQAIFDEAARVAWHLYHHSLTSHTEGITAAAATLAATATDRNNDTREEEEEVRAQAQGAHKEDTTITTTHAEDSTGTHHTLPAHTLHEEHKARAQRPARHLPSLQEEVAAVSNAHFLATYLTSRAVAVGSTHGKAHHTNKTKEGEEEEEGGREVKEEEGSEDATAAAAASSSASLLSFFGSAAETRRQVLALLTDLVACEDTAVVLCESLQPGDAGRTSALSAATPTPTTAASSCDTHTQTSPSSSLAQQQQQQQQADMPCSEVTGHTQAIEQQPQQCDGVRVACTTARRYANARLACAIHSAWASSSSSSSDVLLPEASPLLHRYGTRVLAAFVHRCLYTHTAPSSSSSSSLAVMKTLRRLQPEELSTVLELMDLVQRTAQHPSPSSSLSQRGTTATEASREATAHNEEEQEGEVYDGRRLVCMAALLVLQGVCVTGHCLDGAPRALRCLLQCDTPAAAKAKKATTAADKSNSIITPTGTVSTAGTPLTASSSHHPPPPLSLSSPPVVHTAWSARQAALAACLCAGLERAAGLRVAFADPTADCTSSNTEGRGTGGGDEDDEARTTLIGGGAEGRPWLLYPLYYTNNNNNNDSSSSVDEADTQDKKNNDKEDEGERKEEHNGNNCITSGSNDVVAEVRVDKVVWAHWVMGLTRLQPRLTREVLQCDVVLSHVLLWTLAHRARLFAAEATPKTPPPPTTATTANTNTAACTTTSTSDDDDDEACDMTAAEVHALCKLLAELALLLVPAEVGSGSAHWDSTKKKENRDDAGGEKTGTTTTSASTTIRSAVSVPPAAAAQPPRACVRRQEDEHDHEHDEQTTKESEVHAPLTSPSHDAAHARLSAPPCRFSHAASATLGIPLQAYANPQSEAAMPAIVHCVLGLVAAHAQPATSLAALQLLLSTPVCPTTNTRATTAGPMCGDNAVVTSAHSHAGKKHMQRGQKDNEHNDDDEAGVGECVAPQQEGDDATVADDRMSRLRAALTWWSAAVQPGSYASHSVRDNDATTAAVMHDAACTAASAKGGGLVQAAASSHHDTITTTAARTSCEVVRWSLTQLVALLQLVGPHLSSRTHKYNPTPRMAHTHHHHHPHDDDDAEGDDDDDDEVMSDAAAEDAEDEEVRAMHDMHTTTNNNDEEEDVRRWCVETVTDGLLRRYLYSHTKASTAAATAADTRTSQAATATSTSAANAEAVQLSAMEQTVLRETLRQLHWRPAVLWPYVA